MRLRNQLLALSLLTLLLPWSGWKLVQELENFLREAEETTLLESAQTVSRSLPAEFQDDLKLARGRILPLRQLTTEPIPDGYISDWPETGQSLRFESAGGDLKLDVLAGRYRTRFYLALKVTDPGEIKATSFNSESSDTGLKAGVMLYTQSKRGQQSYMISPAAPGPLTLNSLGGKGSSLVAAWMDDADGYKIELGLPGDVERISVGAVAPAFTMTGVSSERHAGTLNGRQQGQWLELISRDDGVARWLARLVTGNSRAWLVQADGKIRRPGRLGLESMQSVVHCTAGTIPCGHAMLKVQRCTTSSRCRFMPRESSRLIKLSGRWFSKIGPRVFC
jgi:hypothetical protein